MLSRRTRTKGDAAFRYFFATDIHGSDRCFRKFLAAAKVYKANALILGGDIAGKAIVPVVAGAAGRYSYRFQGGDATATKDGLGQVRASIEFNGLYPYVCDPDEYDRIAHDDEARGKLFASLIETQIRDWRALADERLDPDVRCIITPGNDDPPAIDAVLAQPGRVECPEREVVEVGPLLLASLGNTNRTPWDTDREYDEDELAEQISELIEPRLASGPMMFNFHCPPFDSGLDTVIKLDDKLAPVIDRGAPVEVPVGSTAVRHAIERYSPVIGLHGHIHEAHGVRTIGTSVCINPGSEYGSGYLKGAIVDVDAQGQHVSHLLTSG
jgi:uncharacterized protein